MTNDFPGVLEKARQDHRVIHSLPAYAHLVLLFRIGNIPAEKARPAKIRS